MKSPRMIPNRSNNGKALKAEQDQKPIKAAPAAATESTNMKFTYLPFTALFSIATAKTYVLASFSDGTKGYLVGDTEYDAVQEMGFERGQAPTEVKLVGGSVSSVEGTEWLSFSRDLLVLAPKGGYQRLTFTNSVANEEIYACKYDSGYYDFSPSPKNGVMCSLARLTVEERTEEYVNAVNGFGYEISGGDWDVQENTPTENSPARDSQSSAKDGQNPQTQAASNMDDEDCYV